MTVTIGFWQKFAASLIEGGTVYPVRVNVPYRSNRIYIDREVVAKASRNSNSTAMSMFREAVFPFEFRNSRNRRGIIPCGNITLKGHWLTTEEPYIAVQKPRSREGRLRQLCEVSLIVSQAHSEGVVHLDIKPAHIRTDCYDNTYLLDWNASRPVVTPGMQAFGYCGTPEYMAPEQARGEIELFTRSTDVFALGTVLFEILHWKPMRQRGLAFSKIISLVRTERIGCSDRVKKKWPNLASLCECSIAHNYLNRPSNAGAFYQKFKQAIRDDRIVVSSPESKERINIPSHSNGASASDINLWYRNL